MGGGGAGARGRGREAERAEFERFYDGCGRGTRGAVVGRVEAAVRGGGGCVAD